MKALYRLRRVLGGHRAVLGEDAVKRVFGASGISGTHRSISRSSGELEAVEIDVCPRNQDGVIGSYSPGTVMMWRERLLRENERSTGNGSGDLPARDYTGEPKAPRKLVLRYPLSTNDDLVQLYKGPWGGVRIGRLLEDLDSVAGTVAFLHCHTDVDGRTLAQAAVRPVLVTASVDKINVNREPQIGQTFRLEGRPIWTGRSSMDILIQCFDGNGRIQARDHKRTSPRSHSEGSGNVEPILDAIFTFVGRNPTTGKSMALPPLVVSEDDHEGQALFQARQEINDLRKELRTQAAKKAKEAGGGAGGGDTIRNMMSGDGGVGRPDQGDPIVMSKATELRNVLLMQPQDQNMSGKIFGGHLMGRSYELALCSAYQFARVKPFLEEIDKITFKEPVDIGDVMEFVSHIVKVEKVRGRGGEQERLLDYRIHVKVDAFRSNPTQEARELTNQFSYIFTAAIDAAQTGMKPLPQVVINHR